MAKYTVSRHPDYGLRCQVFKWAVFSDGVLFEGFIFRDDAERAAAEYNREHAASVSTERA